MNETDVELPELLFVRRGASTAREQFPMELRGLSDGRRALPVYTSLGALVRCCGDQQPWLSVPRDEIEKLLLRARFDLLVVNVDIPFASHPAASPSPPECVDDDDDYFEQQRWVSSAW